MVRRIRRVEELHHRGTRAHREGKGPRSRKAVLPYRGKGAKVERRSRRSRVRRETG